MPRWPESLAQKCGCHMRLQHHFAPEYFFDILPRSKKHSPTISTSTQKSILCVWQFFCKGYPDSWLSLSTFILLLKSPVEQFEPDSGNASFSHRISTIICERFLKISKGFLVGTLWLALYTQCHCVHCPGSQGGQFYELFLALFEESVWLTPWWNGENFQVLKGS